jgi:hypothetical protein
MPVLKKKKEASEKYKTFSRFPLDSVFSGPLHKLTRTNLFILLIFDIMRNFYSTDTVY